MLGRAGWAIVRVWVGESLVLLGVWWCRPGRGDYGFWSTLATCRRSIFFSVMCWNVRNTLSMQSGCRSKCLLQEMSVLSAVYFKGVYPRQGGGSSFLSIEICFDS